MATSQSSGQHDIFRHHRFSFGNVRQMGHSKWNHVGQWPSVRDQRLRRFAEPTEHQTLQNGSLPPPPQAHVAFERFNRVLKEGLRANRVEGQTFEDSLTSILANNSTTGQATTGRTPAELLIGRRIRMPLHLLALTTSRESVRFQEPGNDHVFRQQRRYKRYGEKLRRAKESKLNPGDQVRVKLPKRATNMDPVWSEPHTVVDTEILDDGTAWNNRKLRVESTAASPGRQPQQPVAADAPVAAPRSSERARRRPARYTDYRWIKLEGRGNGAFGYHMISTPTADIQSDSFLLSYSPLVMFIIPITWFSSDSRYSPSQSLITHFLYID